MSATDTVASEFEFWSLDKTEEVVFCHKICQTRIEFPDFSNLQTALTTLFDHARECEKERNPKPKKRKAPTDGPW